MDTFKIGTITFDQPEDTRVEYEVAAWSSIVRIEPGTYDVLGYRARPGSEIILVAGIKAEGVCVDDNTPTLHGGVRVNDQSDHSTGQTMPAGTVRKLTLRFDPDPGFEVTEGKVGGLTYREVRERDNKAGR